MTKYIELSGNNQGKFFAVDDDDYEELSKYTWYLDSRGYPSVTIKAYQLVLGHLKRDGLIIDHKNGQRLDNRKSNLRFVTHAQNMQNKKSYSKLGYKGVVKRKGNTVRPYAAFIKATTYLTHKRSKL